MIHIIQTGYDFQAHGYYMGTSFSFTAAHCSLCKNTFLISFCKPTKGESIPFFTMNVRTEMLIIYCPCCGARNTEPNKIIQKDK